MATTTERTITVTSQAQERDPAVVESAIREVDQRVNEVDEALDSLTVIVNNITGGGTPILSSVVNTTASITLTSAQRSCNADTTSGDLTITLPFAPTIGEYHEITNTGVGEVTIDGDVTNINGSLTFVIIQEETLSVEYNGTEWKVK